MARTLVIDSIEGAGRTFDSGEELKVATGELEFFVNDEKIDEDFYALITSAPEMPKIEVKNCSNEIVNGRFKIEYEKPYNGGIARKLVDYFPESEEDNELNTVTIEASTGEWEVDFGEKIRGGRITFEYTTCQEESSSITEEDLTESFVFYIRGENPEKDEVMQYIADEGYKDDYWFFVLLTKHESGTHDQNEYRQFNPGNNYGPDWTDFVGCPNFGPPRGWGLYQLDNYGTYFISNLDQTIRDGINTLQEGEVFVDNEERHFTMTQTNRNGDSTTRVVCSNQAMWDWKKNIDEAKELLDNKKETVINAYRNWVGAVNEWNRENEDDNVEIIDDQEEGNITFDNVSSDLENVPQEVNDYFNLENTDPDDTKSFIDATLLRYFNGGYYHRLRRSGNDKPYWVLDRESAQSGFYVEHVCSENDEELSEY